MKKIYPLFFCIYLTAYFSLSANIYRNGKKINVTPIAQSTYFKDTDAPKGVLTYEVRPVKYAIESAKEKFSYTLKDANSTGYLKIPLNIPPKGTTPNGQNYSYQANYASVGDVDGDGEYPSVVMYRGYYTRTVLAAFDWKNRKLTNRWVFDSNTKGNEAYAGQGNHNLRVGDIDGDGCDEIVYGACAIDHDGKGIYSTGFGQGDAMHMTAFDPSSRKLQVWDCHENRKDGSTLLF